MKRTSLALAAVAALSACSMAPQKPSTPNIATNVYELRPGSGVVQSVTPTPAFAGAAQTEPMQRLEIKMSDGKMQYIDTRSHEIARGDRIQLGADGLIRKV